MGYNRRFKLGKSAIGSKGLVSDTIYKGGYLAVGFNKSKKKCLIHMT